MNSEKILACGMSGRLPESDDLEELWTHLMNKEDLMNRDGKRWDSEYLRLPKGSGLLRDLSKFDASFFGMLPKQVEKTEPQLRILLEVAYEAIIDAGFQPQELKGSKTGVYIASSYSDASVVITDDMQATDGYGFQTCLPSFLANRLSYLFDLKGPSYTSCAACATGLLVVRNAMKDILSGECDYAIVGGVTTNLRPQATYSMSQLGVLSPDGVCKPFDETADGFARADAVVALFITRESLCRRAYGQLVHSVTNHCGFQPEGISFPSIDAQTELLRVAYTESGISPKDVEFIEAHGTATKAGDPIEANAMHRVFSEYRSRENPLLIGSVKSNVGHSECTAGLTGLLKVFMTINNGIIPPTIHFVTPKADIIGFQDGTLKVVTEPTKYMGGPVGVNSFGFGGVNVHVIVKPFYVSKQNYTCSIPRILLSSGRTKECVEHRLKYFTAQVKEVAVHHLANKVANHAVEGMPYRGYKILKTETGTDEAEIIDKASKRPAWFIFTGMGAQWPGMGKDLMVLEPFRRTISNCHEVLQATDPKINLMDLIMNGTREKINETLSAFVTTISIQIALVNCLKEVGIQPSGIIGHSMGETVCAFADGCLTEEETILAIYWRGRCVVDGNPPPGMMASVGLGWEDIKAKIPDGVVAACHNAEDNTTVSGNAEAVKKFVAELESEDVFVRTVSTNGIAYHSPDMLKIAPALQKKLDKIITRQTPRSESWISTSIHNDEKQQCSSPFNSSYLVNNLKSPVRFYSAVKKIPSNAVVIEVAPHGLMQAVLKNSLHTESRYISLMNRRENDNLSYFLTKIGDLFNLGLSVDVNKLYPPMQYPLGAGTPMLSPAIKWDHSKKWFVPSWEDFMTSSDNDGSVTTKEIDVSEEGMDTFIKDHNIDDRVLYPATGYIVIAWRAIADMLKHLPEKVAIDFSDITIHRATVIPNSGNVTLKVRIVPSSKLFDISENDELTVSGRYDLPENPLVPTNEVKADDNTFILNREDVYKELRLMGYNYRPKFQGILKSTLDGSEAIVEWNGNWITYLDSLLQVTILGKDNPSRCLYLPIRIRSIRINPTIQAIQNKQALHVKVDKELDTCCSGGVEIKGLQTSMAPKKQVKQAVTMEYAGFVPYGKVNVAVSEDVLDYGRVCRKYLLHVMKILSNASSNKDSKAHEVNIIDEMSLLEKDTPTHDDDTGLLKLLQNIGKLKAIQNVECQVSNMIESHYFQLVSDKLLSYLPKSNMIKIFLDTVWENVTSRKIKAVELYARNGGLFNHVIPSMRSQPMVELDYVAADINVDGLTKVFSTQLHDLDVTTASFDVNDSITNGLDQKDLVVVRGLAGHSQNVLDSLEKIYAMLSNGGFLLLLEATSDFDFHFALDNLIENHFKENSTKKESEIYLTCEEWEEKIKSAGFLLIQQVSAVSTTMFLCRKVERKATDEKDVFISLSEKEYAWVEEVKNELNNMIEQDDCGTIWLVSDEDYQSGVVGLVNCLRQEDGGENIRCIFNASFNKEIPTDSSFFSNLVRTDLVMNVFKNGCWGSYRHHFLDEDDFFVENSNSAYVDILTRGDLSSFQWIQSPVRSCPSNTNQVYCTVHYSSLNFRDVMLASGKLPPGALPDDLSHRECLLGMEFSGCDSQGRKVMGMVENQGIATHVSAESDFIFEVPESWSLEDAATVPTVYTTVYYALVVRGQLKRGESILIHSGSGGVGQAAISVALSYGCKVYTTVGTDEKRKFLMEKFPALPVSCFASSRDLSFEKHVMKQTKGAGVNLVLNSLSEKMFEASLRCLSMHGRFLEIGKYDLSQNKEIGSSMFLKNTSFHGIFLDRLFEKNNHEWPIVAELMNKGIRDGVVQPLQRTVFSRNEVETAFRFMAKGRHIGKILIKVPSENTLEDPSPPPCAVRARNTCYSQMVYMIVGGLGGFGLEVADWLISRGCRKLVLTSRSGIRTGYQHRCVSRWQNMGASVVISTLDISERKKCYELIQQCQKMGPIGGIFNLAMVLKDGLFENLSPDDFKIVCKPKIEAARNLDEATRELSCSDLHWFVMFSSISCGRGNGGQSNYGYANSAMERICEKRREDQLPGLAIQWGVIGDVGVLAESEIGNKAIIGGCEAQKIGSCLSSLDLFLSSSHPVLSSFVKACQSTPATKENSKLDIAKFVSKFFGINDISSVNENVTLSELGLDSLMAVEVKQILERDFATVLSMREVRSLTLSKLLNQLSEKQSQAPAETDENELSLVSANVQVTSPILSFKTKDCLIQLNVGSKDNRPIFLIHPIEGSIEIFRPLAKALSEYPVYAFQSTKDTPNDSISNIAKYFLPKMHSIQPEGPFNIAGYSFGALVGLEIAYLLQCKGSKQNKLLLLDASPQFTRTYAQFVLTKMHLLDENRLDVSLEPREVLETKILLYFIKLFPEIPFEQIKQQLLAKADYQERLDYTVSKLLTVMTDKDAADMTFSVDSFVKRTVAIMTYQPNSTWNMDVMLLKAKSCNEELSELIGSEDYNLSKICNGKVTVHTIEGDHEHILQEPGLQEVATIMRDLFHIH